MYFSTLLCCAGVLPDRNEAQAAVGGSSDGASFTPGLGEVVRRKLTYVEWIYPDLDDYSGKTSLADRRVMYKELTRDIVSKARAEGCIFARKFKGTDAARAWAELVLRNVLV